MKILSNSGLPVIPENEEYEQAKKSMFKTKWLETALDKLIYIPCRFLNELPNHFSYKLIYIEEEITEIEFYKKNNPKKKHPENVISIKDLADFQKDKQVIDLWIESQPALPSLFINLKELIHSPNDTSAVLSDFLNSNISLIVNDKNGEC
jgi:hypothetical protein